jgi:GT2 family glycosyltransferase
MPDSSGGPATPVPDDIRAIADARALARAGKDWPEADRLRAELEAAGWTVVDQGFSYSLRPSHPPTLETGGVVRYGRSTDVPSRLDEPVIGLASVVLVATDWPTDLARALDSLDRDAPPGTQAIVVADGPSPDQEAALVEAQGEREVVWTSARLGPGAALNAAIRRAMGATVVLLDTSVELAGEAISPLVRALDAPTVAVAGPWGFGSPDLRRFEDVAAGPADAIAGYCLAFRRADFASRGPLDERFRFYRNLDIWWSLVLRDEGPGRPPREAIVVPDLPLVRHEHRGWTSLPEAERDRLSKRNFYRIIDRFGPRTDLLREPGRPAAGG